LPRPPRSLVQQGRLVRDFRTRGGAVNSLRVVQPLGRVRGGSMRLTRVNATQLARQRSYETRYRALSVNRQRLERPGRSLVGKPARWSLAGIPAGRAASVRGLPSRPAPYGRGVVSPRRSAELRRAASPNRSFYSSPRSERGSAERGRRPLGRPSYRGHTPRYAPAGPNRSPSRASGRLGSQPRSYYRPESTYRNGSRSAPYRTAPRHAPAPPSRSAAPPRPSPRSYYRPESTYRGSGRPAPRRAAPNPAPRRSPARSAAPTRPAPRSSYRPAPTYRSHPRPPARPAPRSAPARPAPRPAPHAAPRSPSYHGGKRPAPAPRPAPKSSGSKRGMAPNHKR
jgi:hypothetical protein